MRTLKSKAIHWPSLVGSELSPIGISNQAKLGLEELHESSLSPSNKCAENLPREAKMAGQQHNKKENGQRETKKHNHEEIKCFDADPAALTELMRAPVTHHNSGEAVRV